MLVGPQSLSGHYGEEKKCLFPVGSRSQDCSFYSLVTVVDILMSVVEVLFYCIYSSFQAAVVMLFHRFHYVTGIQMCFHSTSTGLINTHCFLLIRKCQSGINAYVCVFYSFFCIIINSSDVQFSIVEPELRTNAQPHIALWTLKFSPPFYFCGTYTVTNSCSVLGPVLAVEYIKFSWFAGERCSSSPWGSTPCCMRSLKNESLSWCDNSEHEFRRMEVFSIGMSRKWKNFLLVFISVLPMAMSHLFAYPTCLVLWGRFSQHYFSVLCCVLLGKWFQMFIRNRVTPSWVTRSLEREGTGRYSFLPG